MLLLVAVAHALVAGSCRGGGGSPAAVPLDGAREYEVPGVVRLPVGRLNTMGGAWSLGRVDLSIDTRLGTRSVGATWVSAGARWQWSFEPTFDGWTFVDPSGARLDAAVPDGGAIAGTHWVRVDATHLATKGGLVHEFDPADGRLVAVRWASADWPRLRYVASPIAGAERTVLVEQCTDAATCRPVYTIERDSAGDVSRIVDRAGRQAEMVRDAQGLLLAARDAKDVAEGWQGQRYEYAGSRLSAVTNSEGERVELTFTNGRLTQLKQVGEGDPTWSFRYLPKSAEGPATLFTTELTDPLGYVARFRYDDQRRLHQRENALGELESRTWSGLRPISFSDAAGLQTAWTWSGDDLATETLPSGNTRVFARVPGAVDRMRPDQTAIASLVDDLGTVLTRTYDGAGRLQSETNAAGDTTVLEWGADEALVRVTEPSGRQTSYGGHGEHGHPTTVSRNGVVWNPVYDAVGNTIHGVDPGPRDGGVVERHWDGDRNLARLVLLDQPASGVSTQAELRIERRSDGRVARILRPLGGDTTLAYDGIGRELARADWVSPGAAAAPVPHITTRTWDLAGRLEAEQQPNGMRRELVHDAAGRVERERLLRSGVVESDVVRTFAQGRPVLVEDVARGFAESTRYDAAGRPDRIVHSGGEVTETAYDVRSRPVRRELQTASGTLLQAVTFGFDAADRLERIGDGSSDLVHWVRADGLVNAVSYGNGIEESASIVLGIVDRREWSQGGNLGAVALYRHESSGRLSVEALAVSDPAAAGTSSQTFVVSEEGQPERRIESSYDASNTYRNYFFDHASNLVRSETPERGAVDWSYNAEHNRLLSGTAAAGEIASWSWDAAGYATSRGGVAFTWSARGRIRTVVESATGSELARFEWDALGRRAARTVNGTAVAWSHGGALELDASGVPVAADLGVVRIALDGQHVYRHTDSRGNVVMRSRQDGKIRTRRSYDAYGPVETVGEGGDLEHGYALGLELPVDPALGPVYLMGERVYDPLIGRFLGPDPVPQWINAFGYTLGNPIEFWDPTGRSSESIDWALVGAWAVAVGSVAVAGVTCVAAAIEPTPFGEVFCAATILIAVGAVTEAIAMHGELDLIGVPGAIDFPTEPFDTYPRGRTSVWEPQDFPGWGPTRAPGLEL